MTVEQVLEVLDIAVDGHDGGYWEVLINDALTRQQKDVLAVMLDVNNQCVLIELDGRIAR